MDQWQSSILVVDDDESARESIVAALSSRGFSVGTAASGADALAVASERKFDLILCELYLPDLTGLHVLNRLRRGGGEAAFMFMSASLTINVVVEAMQAGALTVIEKPLDPRTVAATVGAALGCAQLPRRASDPPADGDRPRSAADRWARYVWKASEAPGDLKTLAQWARFVGVSYSSLCESCRLLDIRPQAARDFMRVLRAVEQSEREECRPEVLLEVSDRRTLRHILDRTGIERGSGSVSLEAFLLRQTFIPAGNEGLAALRALIESARAESRAGAALAHVRVLHDGPSLQPVPRLEARDQ